MFPPGLKKQIATIFSIFNHRKKPWRKGLAWQNSGDLRHQQFYTDGFINHTNHGSSVDTWTFQKRL